MSREFGTTSITLELVYQQSIFAWYQTSSVFEFSKECVREIQTEPLDKLNIWSVTRCIWALWLHI